MSIPFASSRHRQGGGALARFKAPKPMPGSTYVPREDSFAMTYGANNPKTGKRITKGLWAGMPIYTLTLEERASCPSYCHMWRDCYGNRHAPRPAGMTARCSTCWNWSRPSSQPGSACVSAGRNRFRTGPWCCSGRRTRPRARSFARRRSRRRRRAGCAGLRPRSCRRSGSFSTDASGRMSGGKRPPGSRTRDSRSRAAFGRSRRVLAPALIHNASHKRMFPIRDGGIMVLACSRSGTLVPARVLQAALVTEREHEKSWNWRGTRGGTGDSRAYAGGTRARDLTHVPVGGRHPRHSPAAPHHEAEWAAE